jgi:hypothetical protein
VADIDTKPIGNSIVTTTWGYKNEAEIARKKRMERNRRNIDSYHLRQDYSHKSKGQSKEFLARQQVATDQLVSFLTQGLIDLGLWFSVKSEKGVDDQPVLTDGEMEKIIKRQLEKNDFYYKINDVLKVGTLESLMIAKMGGMVHPKAQFVTKVTEDGTDRQELQRIEKPVWDLTLDLVRPQDYYPDPTGRGLYELQRIQMDKHELLEIARQNPEMYDIKAIEALNNNADETQKAEKSRETDQNQQFETSRNVVEIFWCYGTILSPNGNKVLHKDVVWAVTENAIIMKPQKNPWWHNKSPFIVAPISRVPFSVWHRALMDAPTVLNEALNEVYNLLLDGGMMAAFGIRQIRTDYLEDPSQVSGGIAPGITLRANSSMPPGGQVMEPVQVTNMGRESFEAFNITDREFQQSALTNDIRLGNLPERNVKATEIVASNQSLSGMFQGIAKGIEDRFLSPMVEMAWSNIAQNIHRVDFDELVSLFGKARAIEIRGLPAEEIYAKTAQGKKYKVFGLSGVINKINDFRKITTLLQTIGGVPELAEEFKKKYSFPKLMGEVIKSLDIDEDKFLADDEELQAAQQEKAFQKELEVAKVQGRNGEDGGAPDAASQIPQMGATNPESGVSPPRGALNVGITNP